MFKLNENDREYRFGDSGPKYLMKGPRSNFALVQFHPGEDFHARLRRGFAELAKAEPDRIITIDASGTPREVGEAIWKSLRRFL